MRKTLLLLFLSFTVTAFAQKANTSANKQAQKAYQQASEFISGGVFHKAIEQLKLVIAADSGFAAAHQQLGDIYRKLSDYQKAKESYRKVLEINPDLTPLTYFGLAESELNTGEYAEALQHFQKYDEFQGLSDQSRKMIRKYIADCHFSMEAMKHPVSFSPVNLGPGVNTRDQEYLPTVTADEETLIFTRQARNNEDFYKSIKKDGIWTKAEYLSDNINTTMYNEGAQCISPDGLYMFFTGCNRPDGLGRCDIYVSKREGKNWSKPFNIGPPVNTPGWESQPSLSADGKTLYFVSTRPGGYGGYDIWKSELKADGAWSNPVNLGPNINTPYDEQSPFIHPDDHSLYFSSNGWPGLGNKDLFVSRKDSAGNWQKPQNLGYPINTYGEESSLTISSDGKTAFFAADRPGGFGGLDIYSFELPAHVRPQPVNYVKGIIFDKNSQEVLEAKVQIINLASNKSIFEEHSDEETGEFLATMPLGNAYGLNVSKDGYLFYSANFTLKAQQDNKPFHIKVPLQKIEVGSSVILNNIFFDTNKYNLLPESKVELQQLVVFLNQNPKTVIEIGGHTDNVGDLKLNQTLSENRAKTVYNYLINNKINPSRLSYKGYGESRPVADNKSEEGRRANRRTEFKIIKN